MRDARVPDRNVPNVRNVRNVRDARNVRPLLKWAEGKRQLLPELRPFYPKRFDRYVEPSLGSGAVFLDLHNGGFLEGRDVRLSDINADVIGCYRAVRASPDEVIGALRALETGYRSRGAAHFYDVRDRQFIPGGGPSRRPAIRLARTRRRWRPCSSSSTGRATTACSA